jgi:hypothetical protein
VSRRQGFCYTSEVLQDAKVILAEEDIPMDEQIKKYILTRTLPNALDVEVAKRILLDHIDFVSQGQNNLELFSGSQLVNVVEQQSALFANPTSIQPGYENLENTLTSVKAAIAAREALALLQGNGFRLVSFLQAQVHTPTLLKNGL